MEIETGYHCERFVEASNNKRMWAFYNKQNIYKQYQKKFYKYDKGIQESTIKLDDNKAVCQYIHTRKYLHIYTQYLKKIIHFKDKTEHVLRSKYNLTHTVINDIIYSTINKVKEKHYDIFLDKREMNKELKNIESLNLPHYETELKKTTTIMKYSFFNNEIYICTNSRLFQEGYEMDLCYEQPEYYTFPLDLEDTELNAQIMKLEVLYIEYLKIFCMIEYLQFDIDCFLQFLLSHHFRDTIEQLKEYLNECYINGEYTPKEYKCRNLF